MNSKEINIIKRITVTQVQLALNLTGFSLRQKRTLDLNEKCGCPIGLVALATKGLKACYDHPGLTNLIKLLGLDENYADGIIAGFDDHDITGINGNSLFSMGYKDGCAVREALLNNTD